MSEIGVSLPTEWYCDLCEIQIPASTKHICPRYQKIIDRINNPEPLIATTQTQIDEWFAQARREQRDADAAIIKRLKAECTKDENDWLAGFCDSIIKEIEDA